jgi:hypothetical protein
MGGKAQTNLPGRIIVLAALLLAPLAALHLAD